MARRYGLRVRGPFEPTAAGWAGRLANLPKTTEGGSLLLFRNGDLVGPVNAADKNRVIVGAPSESAAAIDAAVFHIVSAVLRKPQNPFEIVRGRMWKWEVGDLAWMADDVKNPTRSSLFVFEDGRQLPLPHAIHADIARKGEGRFSHWGRDVYFAPLSATNPNARQDRYAIVVPTQQA